MTIASVKKEIVKESSMKPCGRIFKLVKNKIIFWNSISSVTFIKMEVGLFTLENKLYKL